MKYPYQPTIMEMPDGSVEVTLSVTNPIGTVIVLYGPEIFQSKAEGEAALTNAFEKYSQR